LPIYVAGVPAAPFSLLPSLLMPVRLGPFYVAHPTRSIHQNRVAGFPRPNRKKIAASRRKVRACEPLSASKRASFKQGPSSPRRFCNRRGSFNCQCDSH